MEPEEADKLVDILVKMGPKDAGYAAFSYDKLREAMRALKGAEPTPEEKARARALAATEALAALKPADLTHEQRVGLYNELVGLLAGGR